MTPSPNSPVEPSRGWTGRPASSSAIRNWPATRSRRRSSEPGATCAGLRDPDRFDAWLHRLTVNACLDIARHRRRRVIEVELDPIDMPDVIDMAGALADREIVDAAMRRLDESGRAIVVLHYFLGMPLTDVASTLGIPIGTVKSRLHRALGEMRVAVETEPPTPAPITGGQVA